MATAVQPSRQTPPQKYDAYVEGQLDKARRRIRVLDLTTALCGFLGGTLVYGIVMALVDSAVTLSSGALFTAFFVYLAAAVAYLGVTVIWPLTQQINPYFAARKVEENLPDAKNSVVNYLDLREDDRLSPTVHNAVGARAARDLAKVDIDRAVSARRAGISGGVLAILVLMFLILLFDRKLASNLGRVFLPFNGGSVATRTELTLLEPDRDPLTVSALQSVTIRVRVDGSKPDFVMLLTRPSLSESAEIKRYMSQEQDPNRHDQWAITLTPDDLKRGVNYRVVAGDASTDERRIEVQATPGFESERFRATFRARPYFEQKKPRIQQRVRALRDFRGTTVTLEAHANRKLAAGAMVFTWEEGPKDKPVKKERVIDARVTDQKMELSFLMDQPGNYRLRFRSIEGEVFEEPTYSPIEVISDEAPTVKLTEPGKDTTSPADGMLKLEGLAQDEVGVKSVILQMQVVNGPKLKGRPYRSEAELRLKDGGFPHNVEYKDSFSLAKLTDADGKPFAVRAGQVLEYWLEASDDCDFPKPNIGKSTAYKVTILEPRQDPKQAAEEQKKAEQEKVEHKRKQDEKLADENRQREEQRKQEEQRNQDARAENKPNDGTNDADARKRAEEQKKRDEEQKKKDEEQKKKDAETQAKHDRAQEAARNAERGKGKDDAENSPNPAGKPNPQPDQQAGKPGDKNEPGKGKDNNKNPGQPQPKPDQAKQGGAEMEQQPGANKDAGKPMPQNQGAAGNKDEQQGGQPQQQTAQGKDNPPPKPDRGQAKQGDPQAGNQAAGAKDQGMGQQLQAAQGKQGEPPQTGAKNGGKDNKPQNDRAQAKDAGKDGAAQAAPKAGPKDMMTGGGAAEDKTAAAPKDPSASAAKDGAVGDNRSAAKSPQKPPEEATKQDVKDIAKDLKNTDPAQRAEARQKLEQIADKSIDPNVRDAAKNELDQTPRDGQDRADAKKPPTDGEKQQSGACKECQNGNAGGASAGKEGPKNDMAGGQGTAKNAGGKDEKKDQGTARAGTKSQDDTKKFDKLSGDLAQQKEKNDAAGQKATQEEIERSFRKLMDDLRSDDPQQREQARQTLKDLSRAAKEDKKAREATPQKAVKEMTDELLKDATGDDPKKREAARNALKELQEHARDNQAANDAMTPEQQKKMDDIAKEEQAKKNGGNGIAGSGGKAQQTPVDPTNPTATAGDPRHKEKAGSLLLDKFNEKVKRQVLQNAGLTDADLSPIREWKAHNPDADEVLLKRTGTSLPNAGIEKVGRGDPAKNIDGTSDGLPPSEYRNIYRKFTERVSETQKTGGDK